MNTNPVIKLNTPKDTLEKENITNEKGNKTKRVLELFGIETVIVVVFLFLALTFLNYFNVVPLSVKYSSIFGWLPHKIQPQNEVVGNGQSKGGVDISSQNQKVKTSPAAVKYLLACPVSPGFCADGKSVYNKNTRKVEGLGYITLGKDLAVYALYDGKIDSLVKMEDGQKKTTITLTGSDNGFITTYVFQGHPLRDKSSSGSAVKQSEIIGQVEGGQLSLFDFTGQKYSLFLSIVNPQNNQDLPVVPRTDGKALDFQ